MRKDVAICAVLATAIMLGGCVGKSQYMEAIAEAETAKTDLERTRAQKTALEQQVKTLKDLNSKQMADNELISAELQRIKESRDKERGSIEGRTKDLDQRVKELTSQNLALRREYEGMKRINETLKATVARYQKELKERPRVAEPGAVSAAPRPPASLPQPVPPVTTPPPQPGSPVPGAQAGVGPVNINTASVGDMTLYLGLTKDMAERVIINRPYKLKGELVAKNVVPKATFDVIKDKITVTP